MIPYTTGGSIETASSFVAAPAAVIQGVLAAGTVQEVELPEWATLAVCNYSGRVFYTVSTAAGGTDPAVPSGNLALNETVKEMYSLFALPTDRRFIRLITDTDTVLTMSLYAKP